VQTEHLGALSSCRLASLYGRRGGASLRADRDAAGRPPGLFKRRNSISAEACAARAEGGDAVPQATASFFLRRELQIIRSDTFGCCGSTALAALYAAEGRYARANWRGVPRNRVGEIPLFSGRHHGRALNGAAALRRVSNGRAPAGERLRCPSTLLSYHERAIVCDPAGSLPPHLRASPDLICLPLQPTWRQTKKGA